MQSNFQGTVAGGGPQSSLSQLAAMTQGPRPTEAGAVPGSVPQGPNVIQQRPGLRQFMPGQGAWPFLDLCRQTDLF